MACFGIFFSLNEANLSLTTEGLLKNANRDRPMTIIIMKQETAADSSREIAATFCKAAYEIFDSEG